MPTVVTEEVGGDDGGIVDDLSDKRSEPQRGRFVYDIRTVGVSD